MSEGEPSNEEFSRSAQDRADSKIGESISSRYQRPDQAGRSGPKGPLPNLDEIESTTGAEEKEDDSEETQELR